MKKILVIILSIATIFGCMAFGVFADDNAVEQEYVKVSVHDQGESGGGNFRLFGHTYGYRFVANEAWGYFHWSPINSFTPNKEDSFANVHIYKWEANLEHTLESEPVYTAEISGKSWSWHDIVAEKGEPMPAGEYLFFVDGASEAFGLWTYDWKDKSDMRGYIYFDDSEAQGMEFPGGKEISNPPELTIGFMSEVADGNYFGVCQPQHEYVPPVEETTAEETTVAETTAPETTAPETTAADTTAADTTVADTTVAATTVAATTEAPAEETTAAPAADTTAAAGTNAPAATTAAAAAEGCKAVVGSMSAIALVAIASAAAVVLKKKED